jgi:hypothetical protein
VIFAQFEALGAYRGTIEGPWDEIVIRYVLVANHIAKKKALDAFKEHTTFVKSVRVFALFACDLNQILACSSDTSQPQQGGHYLLYLPSCATSETSHLM